MNLKFTIIIVLALHLCSVQLFPQGVAINDSGSPANANAILDVSSSSKGILISRMTTSERNALGAQSPSEGMLVYDTDSSSFYYFNNDWVRLAGGSILSTGNAVIITQPLILSGDALVFDDLRVPASSAKSGGTGVPAYSQVTSLGNIYQHHFENIAQAGNEQSLYFDIQMPHSWKEGSSIYPHVHWMPSTTGSGTVRWGLEYTWANIDGTFSTTTTIYGEETIGNVQYKHLMTGLDMGSMNVTGKDGSSMVMCRIFRNSSHANDTYPGEAILLEFDLHYQLDKLGDVYVP